MSAPGAERRAGPAPSGAVRLFWVDAFTEHAFGGNPAAVCLLEGPAPSGAMQALAFELGLSETAFVWRRDDGFELRWFTPAVEVDLCGHATVAAAWALASDGLLGDPPIASFWTRSGLLEASVVGDQVEIDLPSDHPRTVEAPPELASRWPVVAAAAGRTDLVVELASEDAVESVRPDAEGLLDAIGALPYRGVIVTARGGPDAWADYVLRFFGPIVGVPEDAVTGSAQCLLAPYWSARLGRHEFAVAQLSRRGGSLGVTLAGERVRVRGRAVTIVAGELSAEVTRSLTAPPA